MQETLTQLAAHMQLLLIQLCACITSSQVISATVEDLQHHAKKLPTWSITAHSCIAHIVETLKLVSDQNCSTVDMHAALKQLQSSMLGAQADCAQAVHRACSKALSNIAAGVPAVEFAVDQLNAALEDLGCEVENHRLELLKGLAGLDNEASAAGTMEEEARLPKAMQHDSAAGVQVSTVQSVFLAYTLTLYVAIYGLKIFGGVGGGGGWWHGLPIVTFPQPRIWIYCHWDVYLFLAVIENPIAKASHRLYG